MQKTKLILKAKAHGAYNKAKKVYMAKVKQQDFGANSTDRQSERLRNEREVLRAFVECFEGLRRVLVGRAKQEQLGSVAQVLSRLSPQVSDQPAVAFMLDTLGAGLEGMQEGLAVAGHVFEQVIPDLLDGFMQSRHAEAKTVLAQYDRVAKQAAECEHTLATLKAQPKTDIGAIHRQEDVLHQHLSELDALEDRCYDTLFSVNADAQAVLLRCLSHYMRAWSQALQGAALALAESVEALAVERAQCPELAELELPAVVSNSSGNNSDVGGGRQAVPPPSRGAVPPPPKRASTPPTPGAIAVEPPPRLGGVTSSPSKRSSVKMEWPPSTSSTSSPSAATTSQESSFPDPRAQPIVGSSSYGRGVTARYPPPGVTASPISEGESALDQLLVREQSQTASPLGSRARAPSTSKESTANAASPAVVRSSPSFMQPAAPVAASNVRARPSSSQITLPGAGTASSGRQRVERRDGQSAQAITELKQYTGAVYRELAPAESPLQPIASRDFAVRIGKRAGVLTIGPGRVAVDGMDTAALLTHHKSLKHPTRLVITTARGKEKFEFNSCEERERCWEMLWRLRGIPVQDAVTVYCTTFNLGEARMPESLEGWIPEGYDVYAVGVQECEYIPHRQFDSVEADLFDAVSRHLGEGYCKVAGTSLLSIRLLVMVRRAFFTFVTNVKMHRVPCGHLGKVGNKGAVAIAMHVLNTRLCFVTAHLAAHDEKYDERNQDLMAVAQGLRAMVPPGHGPYNHFHGLFLFGDLNYRIDMGRAECLAYIEEGDAGLLLPRDQLGRAMREGHALYGFTEPPITFVPTYRVLRGREGYSEEKMRVPSWTDRVLWRSLAAAPVRVGAYSSCPSVLTSDHRPVFAAFQVGLFKPNLPHGRVRCSISVTQLRGDVPAASRAPCSLAVFSWSLLDPSVPLETVTSYNCQWGDTLPTIHPMSSNPSYVSARHLMLCVRSEQRQTIATGAIPLAPACMASQAFSVHMHDERGLYAGSVSGILLVRFAEA